MQARDPGHEYVLSASLVLNEQPAPELEAAAVFSIGELHAPFADFVAKTELAHERPQVRGDTVEVEGRSINSLNPGESGLGQRSALILDQFEDPPPGLIATHEVVFDSGAPCRIVLRVAFERNQAFGNSPLGLIAHSFHLNSP